VALFASPVPRGNAGSRATLLFLHGKGGAPSEFRRDAVRALKRGWNVLLPHLRGHPPSGGERVTYGFLEKHDLARLLEEVRRRFAISPARLGVDACSFGSLVALHFAADVRPAALWLQAPFGALEEMAARYARLATGLPPWLLAFPVRRALSRMEAVAGFPLEAVDPVAAARRVISPAILIHGEADELVPIRLAPAVYDALSGEKTFWRVPRCGHCHHSDEPQAIFSAEYERRWTEFFSAHLSSGR